MLLPFLGIYSRKCTKYVKFLSYITICENKNKDRYFEIIFKTFKIILEIDIIETNLVTYSFPIC